MSAVDRAAMREEASGPDVWISVQGIEILALLDELDAKDAEIGRLRQAAHMLLDTLSASNDTVVTIPPGQAPNAAQGQAAGELGHVSGDGVTG